jgi:hypothetical protein
VYQSGFFVVSYRCWLSFNFSNREICWQYIRKLPCLLRRLETCKLAGTQAGSAIRTTVKVTLQEQPAKDTPLDSAATMQLSPQPGSCLLECIPNCPCFFQQLSYSKWQAGSSDWPRLKHLSNLLQIEVASASLPPPNSPNRFLERWSFAFPCGKKFQMLFSWSKCLNCKNKISLGIKYSYTNFKVSWKGNIVIEKNYFPIAWASIISK